MFHATIKTADFRTLTQGENFCGIILEDDYNVLTVSAFHIPDDSAYEPSKETLGAFPAEIVSSGKITLPREAVDLLNGEENDRGPSMQAENAEIFRDADKIVIYLDGQRVYTFADAGKDLDTLYKQAQEAYIEERENETGNIAPEEVFFNDGFDSEAEIDFSEKFKTFSHIWDKTTGAAVIEYGHLYITSKKGIASRFFGSHNITTGPCGGWINQWKSEKGKKVFKQDRTGTAYIDGKQAAMLFRPVDLAFNAEKRIAPLFPRSEEGEVLVFLHDAGLLAGFLRKEKAEKYFTVGYKEKHLPQFASFNVGTVKKALAYFTNLGEGPVLSVCRRDNVYYLIITSETGIRDNEFDIIPAKHMNEYSVFPLDFELNTIKPSKIAPKIDATKNTAPNTPKEEKAEQTQADATETAKEEQATEQKEEKPEQAPAKITADDIEKAVKEVFKPEDMEAAKKTIREAAEKLKKEAEAAKNEPWEAKLAKLVTEARNPEPEPENRSAAADQNGPTAAEPVKTAAEPEPVKVPAAVRPLRAIIEEEPEQEPEQEKPFEIGTYTTKKGKVKTAIKFHVTPRPEWVEALKTAFYWEYNGTWNGSPRKLPEIFKH